MENTKLHKKLAYLEFVNDQLTSEVAYLDTLLKEVGFKNGIDSVKEVAHEMIEEMDLES